MRDMKSALKGLIERTDTISSQHTPVMKLPHPGQSHLIYPSQNFQEIFIAPASLETFGFDPYFGSLLVSKQIESQVTEYREIVIGMTSANA